MEWTNFRRMGAREQQSAPRSKERSVPKRTIEDLVNAKYEDDDVRQHILQAVKDSATEERILSGELVLPGPEDALRNYQIATGTFAATPREREMVDKYAAMERRLQQLEALSQPKETKEGQ